MTEKERAQLAAIRALLARGAAEEAIQALQALRAAATADFLARDAWRLHELFGAAFRLLGDAEGCAQAYYEAARADRFLRSQREHYAAYLFALHYLPGIAAETLAAQHFACGRLYGREDFSEDTGAREDSRRPVLRAPCEKEQGSAAAVARSAGPLRVGFLAPEFLDSAAARFYDVFFDLPQVGFSLFAYSLSEGEDEETARVRARTAAYRVLPAKDAAAAVACVHADRLDVLVDLGGHTAGGVTLPLVAQRLAPVQIEAVGWFDTTGVPAVDALLTDGVMDPPGVEPLFTERLCRLPQAWCFTPATAMRAAAETVQRRAARVGVTLAAFGNFLKLNGDVLACWREVLQRLPEARLILQDTLRVPARVRHLRARLAAAGFPPRRVDVRLGSDTYLRDLAQADLALDPFPYPGGAMTGTALALGVPVVTMAGDHHSARVGCSLLAAAGHAELIAHGAADYVRIVCALAGDDARRARLREDLLRQQAPAVLSARRRAYVESFAALLRVLAVEAAGAQRERGER